MTCECCSIRTGSGVRHSTRSASASCRSIGSIEGAAIGAGFGLAGVCDLVVAGEEATFGLTEINVGLLGGASKALRLLGPSKARRMLFLGEMIPAAELYRLGGIEEVVPAGEAETRALELASDDGKKEPHSPAAGQGVGPSHRGRRDDAAVQDGERLHQPTPGLQRLKGSHQRLHRKATARWTWS